MCGFAGILRYEPDPDLGELAERLGRKIGHRGPDDHGWLLLTPQGLRLGREQPAPQPATLALVQRRLSILDLSEAGRQPMLTPDGRYAIVFNGEIYNYVELRAELQKLGHNFLTQTDTEVLLYAYLAWGRAALKRLIGMFAFAILDMPAQRLFLARDAFGIKPLYYVHDHRGAAFGSEIKALLELPDVSRAVHPQRLWQYLRFGQTDHGADTMFAQIKQLPSAHWLDIRLDGPASLVPVPYWDLDLTETVDLSLDEAACRLRALFLESVRLHLRSDVPVGAALSGGIDSSAIVAVMRHLEPNLDIHTFSYVAEDPTLSEKTHVDVAVRHVRAVQHTVQPTPGELVDDLDRLIDCQDEPFGGTSIYAQQRVFRLAKEAGITVMLDGQGADEMLAGYRWYLSARLASLLRKGSLPKAWRLLGQARNLPATGGLARLCLRAGDFLLPEGLQSLGRQVLGKELMLPGMNRHWFLDHGVKPFGTHTSAARDVLRHQLHQSLIATSLPMLLRYEDRNSMAYGIESRVPFLTVPLAEFILRLPEEYLISPDGTTKNVFRVAMKGLVPEAILARKDKIGFATPERGWLEQLYPWVDRVLRSDSARAIPALKAAEISREWQDIRTGRRSFDPRVWRWVNLIRWAERFQVRFPEAGQKIRAA
jgi:asparagine synthase (glutamine-hydrolysing)